MQKEHKSHPDTSGSSRPASPTQHPVTSTQRWGRVNTASPFLAISSQFLVFSVQTSRSPVMTNAQVLLFRVVSFQAFLYCGNKKHNLDMPCFINHSLNLHLPVSLCRKATLALFQYPSESNTRDTCPTCHYHQDSKTAGTQEKNSSTNSTATPQSFTVTLSLMFFLLLQPAPNSRGVLCPLLSLSLPLSCGKGKHMPWSQACWKKISVLIYYKNIWQSPTLPRLLKIV